MAVGSIATILGSIIAVEGVVALLKQLEGDPEADVELALQQLAARNRRRALALESVEQLGQEDVEQRLSAFNRIPGQVLSRASLAAEGGASFGPRDTALLDWVSEQLGVPPQTLSKVSSPRRMGDLSSTFRSLQRPLPVTHAPETETGPQGM